ncbi:MAG: hypothetical protein JJ975_13995 [Bacteroidia bacterium]|nr:hypothetical protein [Bacteroidia bacterium]
MNISLTTVLIVVLAGLIIRFASQILVKLLGWLLLIAGGVYLCYQLELGPFKQNPISIQTWEDRYCLDAEEQVKCNCIVNPIKNDLESRFTAEELSEMESNRMELSYAIKQSYSKVKPQIESCLESENAEDEFEDFIRDLLPVDNDILLKLESLKDDISATAEEKFDQLNERKEKIDEKYSN